MWDGHEVATTEAADLSLDTALLVAALEAGPAEMAVRAETLPTTGHLAAKRAVLYLRVSTERQVKTDLFDPEGYSLPAQREAGERKAEQLGAVVVKEFVDYGESAKALDRPDFLKMLAWLRQHRGEVDYVIIDKVNRWARNRRDDSNTLFEIEATGARLVSVKENIDQTPAGRLIHGVLATIAEYESLNLGVEIKKGLTRKAQVGGTPRPAPIGYLNKRVTNAEGYEVATVVVDPERAPLISYAFETYATGQVTQQQLLADLTARGLRTRATKKRTSKALHPSALHTILTNRYYLGLMPYKGVEYQGRHEALVTPELFEQVQAVLRSHHRGEKQRRHAHYLKSTIYCGVCDSRLLFTHSRGRYGDYYDYFFCVGRQKHRTDCQLPYLPVASVETEIETFHRTRAEAWVHRNRPQWIGETKEVIKQLLERRTSEQATEGKRQQRRLTRLERERAKLLQAFYADALTLDQFKTEQDRISREITEAERLIAGDASVFTAIDGTLTKALTLAANFSEAYQQGDNFTRRGLNQSFFNRLRVCSDGTVTAEPIRPMGYLMDPQLARRLEEEAENPDPSSSGRGSREIILVDDAGFEPVFRDRNPFNPGFSFGHCTESVEEPFVWLTSYSSGSYRRPFYCVRRHVDLKVRAPPRSESIVPAPVKQRPVLRVSSCYRRPSRCQGSSLRWPSRFSMNRELPGCNLWPPVRTRLAKRTWNFRRLSMRTACE